MPTGCIEIGYYNSIKTTLNSLCKVQTALLTLDGDQRHATYTKTHLNKTALSLQCSTTVVKLRCFVARGSKTGETGVHRARGPLAATPTVHCTAKEKINSRAQLRYHSDLHWYRF
ncbi:hypothetical protein O3G_MSEX005529 [Manduca sexta]|uniref:Uncharacterized protein n=1 Tax=Manduca sexta TaxID=7130 RepID=A0A922CJN2_MANSE|nr:hypothetical protein O3G_MSEX005529 [Manduca sexta]